MTVTRAAVLGRCMGVRRAVELALSTAAAEVAASGGGAPGPVYTLGPLIHNPQAVADLAAKGVVPLAETELDGRVAGRPVVIRAHGVPPAARERLAALGARIVDATCPRVLASQRRARDFSERGYLVVIAGDRDHGEVAGVAGYAPGALVIGSPAEAERIEASGPLALIAQTTIRAEEYAAIREVLARRFPLLEVVESICPATEERRRALAELSGECDAIVVVGGRNSANTSRLLVTAKELGRPAWLVETAAELPEEVFSFARVGVTAGASTPDELVAEVEDALLAGGAARGGAASPASPRG
ncbi:MAG: 4-hydroxy-3-methylbut-2-enyl diphosphate reductase [Spirochaetaceae bacterium]|nr:4-hydroxy-3-methylbut-2-enyl diphosphate reductase [Spirochaetaceae bacterium]